MNPRLLVPRRNTPLLSAFAYVKGVDFTVGCSSPRKNAARFIRGPRIWFGAQEVTGNPVTLQHNKKRQGKTLSFLLVRMFIRDLINTPERTIIFQKRTFLNNPLLRYNVLAKVRDEKTGEILRYLPFFGM